MDDFFKTKEYMCFIGILFNKLVIYLIFDFLSKRTFSLYFGKQCIASTAL